ncbi:CD82 antigen [Esox lucius]|uniref:Tetraspanin n=1 Tax=Esox lucius TaxID=8010 RepID=A0A3P8YL57_ESOLU|nr:CD82 antigen [Esox lucius]
MGKGCISATKYFLFLFNLIFLLFGTLIIGFGLWVLLDNQSFMAILQESSMALKISAYVLIGVGALSMLMGFLGCLGAIYEIRCLLALYFTCLLLILIGQVAAGVLIYYKKDLLNEEMSSVVTQVLANYPGKNGTTEKAWDFIQRTMECCGWTSRMDWHNNAVIVNSSQLLFPCSCQNVSLADSNSTSNSGFCEAQSPDWPVFDTGCSVKVESWLLANVGMILGVCVGVAVIELLGLILSICLCKSVRTEEYTKVPKY